MVLHLAPETLLEFPPLGANHLSSSLRPCLSSLTHLGQRPVQGMAYSVIAPSHKPNMAPEQFSPAVLGFTIGLEFGQTIAVPIELLLLHTQPQRPRSILEWLRTVRVRDALQLLAIVRSITPPINKSQEKINHAGPLMAVR